MLRTKTRLIIFHCNTVKGIVMYTECGSFWKSMINIWIIHDVYLTNRVVGQNIVQQILIVRLHLFQSIFKRLFGYTK